MNRWFCTPSADDFLPHPQACLVTGISPQLALERGVPECEFIGRILRELALPGTCGVGYNSLRFDDEVTRHTLYRNFHEPYAREWQTAIRAGIDRPAAYRQCPATRGYRVATAGGWLPPVSGWRN